MHNSRATMKKPNKDVKLTDLFLKATESSEREFELQLWRCENTKRNLTIISRLSKFKIS